LIALGLAVCAVWVYLLAFRGRFWLMRDADSQPLVDARGSIPGRDRKGVVANTRVTAVVPARNEEPVVGRSLLSLSRQEFAGDLQIVVVDDDSEDATAEVALRYATVIRGAPLLDGWTGKIWAVSQGIAHSGAPDYLLLTDADVVHAPGNLAGLVARAEREGYDMVSYMAELRCQSLAERALIPAFVFFFFLLYPPAWVRDPRRATAGAAGGCILIRREMLDRIGGIAAIRGELIDDCALARAVKRAEGRVWLGLSRSVESIREYGTFGEVARMISRTAFTQLRYSAAIMTGTVAGLAFVYLLPPALALTGNLYGAAAWLMMSIAYYPVLRFYRRNPLWAPMLPAIAAFYMACTVASAIQYWRGGGGNWKGRSQASRPLTS
jgi:hopene-associated glycosyltransferase HpnB